MTQKRMAVAEATTNAYLSLNAGAKLQKKPDTTKSFEKNLSGGIDDLMIELAELEAGGEEEPQEERDVPFFIVRSANDLMAAEREKEPPMPLWLTLWYEGQLACLFANSGAGKSIYAVQIGVAIAYARKVVYFDFELSDAQFYTRYSDEWNSYTFPPTFRRATISVDYFAQKSMPDLIAEIEATTLAEGADVLIVDNITWLASATEKAEDAGRLMQRLMRLKLAYGWSILVIAHTPKREKQQAITENDLAGSRVLFNFFDSAFAIGQSQRGEGYRYIKQIKTRMGALEFGSGNVILTELAKDNCFLHHKTIGFGDEEAELTTRKPQGPGIEEMRAVFARILGCTSLRYTDLWRAVMETVKRSDGQCIGERMAKNYVAEGVRNGIIVKNAEGKYMMSSAVVQNSAIAPV